MANVTSDVEGMIDVLVGAGRGRGVFGNSRGAAQLE